MGKRFYLGVPHPLDYIRSMLSSADVGEGRHGAVDLFSIYFNSERVWRALAGRVREPGETPASTLSATAVDETGHPRRGADYNSD